MKLDSVPGLEQFCTFVVFTVLLVILLICSANVIQYFAKKPVKAPQVVSTVTKARVVDRKVSKQKDGTIIIQQTLQPDDVKVDTTSGRERVTFYITPDEINTTERIKPEFKKNFYVGGYTTKALYGVGFSSGLLNGAELPWLFNLRLETGLLIANDKVADQLTGAWLLLLSKDVFQNWSIGVGTAYSVKYGSELTFGIRGLF